jgi:hypothetical protein
LLYTPAKRSVELIFVTEVRPEEPSADGSIGRQAREFRKSC